MIGAPYSFDAESPSPQEDGGDCKGWYAIDDIVHVNNAVFSTNRIYVDEVFPDTDDYTGFRPNPEGFCHISWEYKVETDVDNPEIPVFVGKRIEKGAQTDVGFFTVGAFYIARLRFEVWDIDGDRVIVSISHAGEELEITADSSTGKAFYAYLGGLE
ncbi:hypothetical protein [Hyphomonas sp.]|jgi:hypothetical protein|uniref:hypothetical protein n=1 Tax=Hyphomonas sp. TaxID=87 RepID=UPI0039E219A4